MSDTGNSEILYTSPNDRDERTLALRNLFNHCFHDKSGRYLLPDGPVVFSLGTSVMAPYEYAALTQLDQNAILYAVEPNEDGVSFSKDVHEYHGDSGQFNMLQMTAEDFRQRLKGKTNSQLTGARADAIVLRNAFGIGAVHDLPGLLYSSTEVVNKLAELVREFLNPGGLFIMTYSYQDPSEYYSVGPEKKAVDRFRGILRAKGLNFEMIHEGEKPTTRDDLSALVFHETGADVGQRSMT